MTLQASGAISLQDIAAEFGGSAPHSLTEYYRGGSLVPNTAANSGIPTSGAISLEDFYGASAQSGPTNNSGLDWNNITGNGAATTNNQTVTHAAELTYTHTVSYGSSVSVVLTKNGSNTFGATDVVPGDVVSFTVSTLNQDSGGTVTVSSDGVVIDTFTYDILNTNN